MPFTSILQRFVSSHGPAVQAAIFCDSEGEKVAAAAGALEPFDVDVVGATLAQAAQRLRCGSCTRVVTAELVVWMVVVDLGYYLVVWCAPGLDLKCRADVGALAAALVGEM